MLGAGWPTFPPSWTVPVGFFWCPSCPFSTVITEALELSLILLKHEPVFAWANSFPKARSPLQGQRLYFYPCYGRKDGGRVWCRGYGPPWKAVYLLTRGVKRQKLAFFNVDVHCIVSALWSEFKMAGTKENSACLTVVEPFAPHYIQVKFKLPCFNWMKEGNYLEVCNKIIIWNMQIWFYSCDCHEKCCNLAAVSIQRTFYI